MLSLFGIFSEATIPQLEEEVRPSETNKEKQA